MIIWNFKTSLNVFLVITNLFEIMINTITTHVFAEHNEIVNMHLLIKSQTVLHNFSSSVPNNCIMLTDEASNEFVRFTVWVDGTVLGRRWIHWIFLLNTYFLDKSPSLLVGDSWLRALLSWLSKKKNVFIFCDNLKDFDWSIKNLWYFISYLL